MKSKVTTKPAVEPVTLAEVKSHLRLDSTEEDGILNQMITDARDIAERWTNRKFITQTLTSYAQPCGGHEEPWWEGTRRGSINLLVPGDGQFIFNWGNAQSVTSIHTIDLNNNENLYAATNYYLDNADEDIFPSVQLNNDSESLGVLRARNSIKIVWVAGYGPDAEDVPGGLRRGILQLIGHMYTHRGDCVDPGQCVEASGAKGFLQAFMIETI